MTTGFWPIHAFLRESGRPMPKSDAGDDWQAPPGWNWERRGRPPRRHVGQGPFPNSIRGKPGSRHRRHFCSRKCRLCTHTLREATFDAKPVVTQSSPSRHLGDDWQGRPQGAAAGCPSSASEQPPRRPLRFPRRLCAHVSLRTPRAVLHLSQRLTGSILCWTKTTMWWPPYCCSSPAIFLENCSWDLEKAESLF